MPPSEAWESAVQSVTVAANASWCPPSAGYKHNVFRIYTPEWRKQLRHVYPQLRQRHMALDDSSHDVYEFGVWRGYVLLHHLRSIFPHTRLWGFDTFTGLPASTDDIQLKEWLPGNFMVKNINKTINFLTDQMRHGRGARFVQGLFNESLTPGLGKELGMRPAAYLELDCDLYDSTIVALEFMFRERLVVPGTIVGYDDFWTIPCAMPHTASTWEPETTGEWRAHLEVTARYKVQFECLAGACRMPPAGLQSCDLYNSWAPIFIVRSVGGATVPASGISMSAAEMQQYRRNATACTRMLKEHHVVARRGGATLLSSG